MIKSFVSLFLPVGVAAVGFGVRSSHPTLGYALLVVAGVWMIVGFPVRHRGSA
jgi:uncharacterized membrane protein YuzA (DUF378 family)